MIGEHLRYGQGGLDREPEVADQGLVLGECADQELEDGEGEGEPAQELPVPIW